MKSPVREVGDAVRHAVVSYGLFRANNKNPRDVDKNNRED